MKKYNRFEYRDNKRLIEDRKKIIYDLTLLKIKMSQIDVIDDCGNLTDEFEDLEIKIDNCHVRIIKIDDVLLSRLYKEEVFQNEN